MEIRNKTENGPYIFNITFLGYDPGANPTWEM